MSNCPTGERVLLRAMMPDVGRKGQPGGLQPSLLGSHCPPSLSSPDTFLPKATVWTAGFGLTEGEATSLYNRYTMAHTLKRKPWIG